MRRAKRAELLTITSMVGELPASALASGEPPAPSHGPSGQSVRLAVNLRGLARVDEARGLLLGALTARIRQREDAFLAWASSMPVPCSSVLAEGPAPEDYSTDSGMTVEATTEG